MVKLITAMGTQYLTKALAGKLKNALTKAKADNQEVDIAGIRFTPTAASILTNAYITGCKIINGTPLLMKTLEENLERSKIIASEYDTVLQMPDDYTQFISAIKALDKNIKYRIDPSKCYDDLYVAFVTLALICRPAVQIYVENDAGSIMRFASRLLQNYEGHTTKYWCLKRGVLMAVDVGPDGKYDMGEYGKVTAAVLRERFFAVPYEFSTVNMRNEWRAAIDAAIDFITVLVMGPPGETTLYEFIER